jgi:hypothetical protein
MKQKTTNQEHSKKHRRTQPSIEADQPSKAPRQDENGRDVVASPPPPARTQADGSSSEQGVSNRPANEEHAFPDSPGSAKATDSGEPRASKSLPPQRGGNRGGV